MGLHPAEEMAKEGGCGVVGGDTKQSSLHSDTDGATVEIVLDLGTSGTDEKRGRVPRGQLG